MLPHSLLIYYVEMDWQNVENTKQLSEFNKLWSLIFALQTENDISEVQTFL